MQKCWPLTRPLSHKRLCTVSKDSAWYAFPHHFFHSSEVQSLSGCTLSWTLKTVDCRYLLAKLGTGTSGPCHSPFIFFSLIFSARALTLFQPLFLTLRLAAMIEALASTFFGKALAAASPSAVGFEPDASGDNTSPVSMSSIIMGSLDTNFCGIGVSMISGGGNPSSFHGFFPVICEELLFDTGKIS